MKKLLVLLIAFLLVMPVLSVAEEDLVKINPDKAAEIEAESIVAPSTTATAEKALKIKTLAVLGKGIAVSPSDPMDFKMVKVGIGTVNVGLVGETTSITVGVLFLDEDRYKLKEITIAEGEARGNVYSYSSNGTGVMTGSFNLKSVMKGDQEVWAGTITISGETYYLYVIGAERRVNADEYRDKVADYCRNNPDDENCRDKVADYCRNNPDDNRCQALFMAHCMKGDNLNDERCRDFAKRYCKEHPEKSECRVLAYRWSNKYCQEHSDSALCAKIGTELVEFCMKEPNHETCREFCEEHPEKCRQVVKNLADFCVNNENHEQCREYCKEHPAACKKVAESVVSICAQEPNRDECREYCKEHPVACGLVTAELAKFCIGNAENERCRELCSKYPNVCKKITTGIDTYCQNHPDSLGCQVWCKKYPERCATGTEEPEVEDISDLEVEPITPTNIENATNTGG